MKDTLNICVTNLRWILVDSSVGLQMGPILVLEPNGAAEGGEDGGRAIDANIVNTTTARGGGHFGVGLQLSIRQRGEDKNTGDDGLQGWLLSPRLLLLMIPPGKRYHTN